MDPVTAQVGLQAFSLLSGAGAEARQNRAQIRFNNIALGGLQEQLRLLPELTQAQEEMAQDRMNTAMDTMGMGYGIQWEQMNQSIDSALDTNKFSNYGQIMSTYDRMEGRMQDKLQMQMKNLVDTRDNAIAMAQAQEVQETARIDNQIKLLKKQNQEARKRDSFFETLF